MLATMFSNSISSSVADYIVDPPGSKNPPLRPLRRRPPTRKASHQCATAVRLTTQNARTSHSLNAAHNTLTHTPRYGLRPQSLGNKHASFTRSSGCGERYHHNSTITRRSLRGHIPTARINGQFLSICT